MIARLLVLVWLLPVVCTAAAVPDLDHTSAAACPRETVELQEAWRVGEDGDDIFFGDVQQVLTDGDGNLLVLDMQQCCIQVFDRDGGHLRTLSREGDGPGEVRSPYSACILPDGGVAMSERFVGKIVILAADGTPRDTWNLEPQLTSINTVLCRCGSLLLAGQRSDFRADGQTQHFILAGYDPDGNHRCTYAGGTNELRYHPVFELHEAASYTARQRLCALGPDGRVYAATSRNEYRIEVFRPDGERDRVIRRSFTPRRRTDEERARLQALFEDQTRNINIPKKYVSEPCDPALEYLHVDDDGRLWVQHARSWRDQPAGTLLALDVFDPEGTLERRVNLRGPGNPRDDVVWLLPDGRVVVVIGGVGGERALDDGDALERPLQVMMLEPVAPRS